MLGVFLLASAAAYSQNSDKKAWKRYRKERRKEFLQKERSPLDRRSVRRVRYFAYAPKWRVPAKVNLIAEGATVAFATSSGVPRDYVAYATLTFGAAGDTHTLTVYRSANASRLPAAYRDYLFLPFTDATNGSTSYGGGRYLDLRITDLRVENFFLDFNRAYNPYCAYAEGYSCPVPPPNNRLPLAIVAGECNFAATFE